MPRTKTKSAARHRQAEQGRPGLGLHEDEQGREDDRQPEEPLLRHRRRERDAGDDEDDEGVAADAVGPDLAEAEGHRVDLVPRRPAEAVAESFGQDGQQQEQDDRAVQAQDVPEDGQGLRPLDDEPGDEEGGEVHGAPVERRGDVRGIDDRGDHAEDAVGDEQAERRRPEPVTRLRGQRPEQADVGGRDGQEGPGALEEGQRIVDRGHGLEVVEAGEDAGPRREPQDERYRHRRSSGRGASRPERRGRCREASRRGGSTRSKRRPVRGRRSPSGPGVRGRTETAEGAGERGRDRIGRARGDLDPVLVPDVEPGAGEVQADDREAAGHGLDDDGPSPVAKGGKEEDVARPHLREDLGARAPRGPDEAVGDPQARGQLFEPRPLRPLADELECRPGRDAAEDAHGLERQGQALDGVEAADVEQSKAVPAGDGRGGRRDVLRGDAVHREIDDLVRPARQDRLRLLVADEDGRSLAGRAPPGRRRPPDVLEEGPRSLLAPVAAGHRAHELARHLLAAADRPPDEGDGERGGGVARHPVVRERDLVEEVEALAAVELDRGPGRRALPEIIVDARAQVPVAQDVVEPRREVDVADLDRAAVPVRERPLDPVAVEGPGDEMEVGEAGDLAGQVPAQDGLAREMGGGRPGMAGVGGNEDLGSSLAHRVILFRAPSAPVRPRCRRPGRRNRRSPAGRPGRGSGPA